MEVSDICLWMFEDKVEGYLMREIGMRCDGKCNL